MYLDTSNSFSPSRIARIIDELPIPFVEEVSNHHIYILLFPIVVQGVIIIISIVMV